MKNVAISVIMPVYNSDRYVRSAIESVLRQDFDSFELILVDDGSTDASGAICDEYVAKDNRVKVIHQKNAGTSAARNVGLANAVGNYITFCDHDDEYLPHLLKDNYEIAERNQADAVGFSLVERHNYKHGFASIYKKFRNEKHCDENTIAENYALTCTNPAFNNVWCHLYKKSIVETIKFNPIYKHGCEDYVFNLEVLKKSRKIVYSENVYYLHVIRSSSSSYNFSRKMSKNTIDEYLRFFSDQYNSLMFFVEKRTDIPNASRILIDNLYFVFSRCNFRKLSEVELFAKHPLFSNYPVKLSSDEQLFLEAFKRNVNLFKKLCRKGFLKIKKVEKERIFNDADWGFFETSLYGFFANLYDSKRGRWLFNLCETLVKTATFPFKLFK